MSLVTLAPLALFVLGPFDPPARDARRQQGAQPPAIAAEIARSLRTRGDDWRALLVLTQARGAQPTRVMDEIADTLAAVAIDPSRNDLVSTRARQAAISTLRRAAVGELIAEIGVSRDTPFGVARGIPFAGAAERLQRIVERSHYVDARQIALRELSLLNRTPEFLGYLRQLAVAPTGIAAMAVEILLDRRGPEGRAIVRELYKSNAIRNYEALWILQGKASALGW